MCACAVHVHVHVHVFTGRAGAYPYADYMRIGFGVQIRTWAGPEVIALETAVEKPSVGS